MIEPQHRHDTASPPHTRVEYIATDIDAAALRHRQLTMHIVPCIERRISEHAPYPPLTIGYLIVLALTSAQIEEVGVDGDTRVQAGRRVVRALRDGRGSLAAA